MPKPTPRPYDPDFKSSRSDLVIKIKAAILSILYITLCIVLAYINCTLLWMLLSSPLTAPGTIIALGIALFIFMRYWLRE